MNEPEHRDLAAQIQALTANLKNCETLTPNEKTHMDALEIERVRLTHSAFGPGYKKRPPSGNPESDEEPTDLNKGFF